tara:strand:+ start:10629 stop:11063 length:435 start_codon:yes stop_codon:yes gene_type:complete
MKKEDFKKVLVPIHGNYWQRAYKKLLRKISTLKSTLRRRSKDNNILFDIDTPTLKKMIMSVYGDECKYCNKILTYRNTVCDHIIPVIKGGPSTEENLQFICKTCNTRKGPLNETDFSLLINLVEDLPDELSSYVMRKLAKGGRY